VASFPVLHHLGGALESTDLADACDILGIPLHAEFEVLVRVKTLSVNAELGHEAAPFIFNLDSDLSSYLLQLDDHELRRLEWRESNDDVDDSQIDIILRRRFFVALDEIGIFRCGALEGALPEQIVHECADVKADLGPQRLIIGFEDHPLQGAVKALFEKERG